MQKPTAKMPAPAGKIDIEGLIKQTSAKIPPNMRAMFDKVVLSGMRIMFDKNSHQMMLEQLNQPGPMAKRLSDGLISLIYMLWQKSNKSIPPQLIVPATVVLMLRAFQFLQQSQDPEATPQVLGEAMHAAVQGILDRFGATEDKLPQLAKAAASGQGMQPGQPAPAGPGAAPGGAWAAAKGGMQ